MDLHLICEPVDQSALWITDIMDGIVRESMKKALNLIAVTDGRIRDDLYRCSDIGRLPVLVTGYSLPWINETLSRLYELGTEPVLVSVYQHRFRCEYSYVSFNTAEAMRSLVGYLAGCGRSGIALFGLHRDTVGDLSKLSGFTAGMRDFSLPFTADDIYSRGIIAECAKRLYENISHYQAVVCTNDLLAIYLTLYLQNRGVRVPEDIFITGFGNWSAAERFHPNITRMYTDLTELGTQAVRLHQALVNHPTLRHATSVLECSLRIAESTANTPGGASPPAGSIPVISAETAPPYNTDPDIMEVLRSELFVRNTDSIDLSILRCMASGLTYAQISESANVSESTIKYRLSKMQRLGGFADRHALLDFAAKFNLL